MSDHIQALAGVSKLISQTDFRTQVYAAQTAAEIYELFKSYCKPA